MKMNLLGRIKFAPQDKLCFFSELVTPDRFDCKPLFIDQLLFPTSTTPLTRSNVLPQIKLFPQIYD